MPRRAVPPSSVLLLTVLLRLQCALYLDLLHHVVQNVRDRNDSDRFVVVFIVHDEHAVHSAGEGGELDPLRRHVIELSGTYLVAANKPMALPTVSRSNTAMVGDLMSICCARMSAKNLKIVT